MDTPASNVWTPVQSSISYHVARNVNIVPAFDLTRDGTP